MTLLTKLLKQTKYSDRFTLNKRKLEEKGHMIGDEYIVTVTEDEIIMKKIKK